MSDLIDSLPEQIPATLRRRGIVLPEPDHGLIAWERVDALGILASLDKTKVAIPRGEVYRALEEAPIPLDDWYCKRLRGEHAAEFAHRSRSVATTFVRHYVDDGVGASPFVLIFCP